ncbi:hypothetical protein GQ43DRAFT_467959 [Delitschia confertaspora ATCC 74209]|uniref:Uncharacterized protein n=1 Tax=Delitschia confertaspora ATCC 74209 TaxID=1513339 RepID=A0A9P4JV69_9PLEO|nr:hypothetical protein GQ43DRAFT_467959 [Delitschia confertaspora ATCC 74209]
MSQFPQAPPAGAYEPPNGGIGTPQPPASGYNQQPQGQYYQQSPSPHQNSAPAPYVPPQQPQKGGPTARLGNILDQAVTTGKPFLNKLGKTISSKVGGKHSAQPTPQHLESYQQYQGHQQQQQQHPQSPQYPAQANPQQPQQWHQNSYSAPQPSPYPGSNYATPASGHSGNSNYFVPQQQQQQQPQQQPQQLQPQQIQPQQIQPQHQQQLQSQNSPPTLQLQHGAVSGYNSQHGAQAQNMGQPHGQLSQVQLQGQGQLQQPQIQAQGQPQQQQFQPQGQQQIPSTQSQFQGQGLPQQAQFQGQGQQQPQQNQFHGVAQPQQNQFQGQPGGAIHSATPESAPTPPNVTGPVNQQQWVAPSPSAGGTPLPNQAPSPASSQHPQPFVPTPPPQSYGAAPPPPQYPHQQQHQQPHWTPTSPLSPTDQPGPPPVSPPMQHAAINHETKQSSGAAAAQASAQNETPSSAAPSPKAEPPSAPTEFIAELPAEVGNLNIVSTPQMQSSSNSPQPSSQPQYEAYQPPHLGPMQSNPGQPQGFSVPRRAVSMVGMPLADPWRIADPTTEQPTREFFIIADLLFDGLDRRCEPQNTGMLEASKILQSWKAQGMANEVAELFAHDSFRAFGSLWALEGVPHFMVPCQPGLTPLWTAKPAPESLKLLPELPAQSSPYPTYMPALNRSGWYKYLFLELLGEPESLEKILPLFCADTYRPNGAHHPNLTRRDRGEPSGLNARANQIRTGAIARVCQETAAVMQQTRSG